jgi:tRNA (guanosine-2'-O-)-methyltransferase
MNNDDSSIEYKEKLCSFYRSLKLENRNLLMDKVLADRTRYVTVVLENIFQPHNASAVLRSCDCFGVQDVHIIENSYQYELNPHVSLGSTQWLSLNHYNSGENNTPLCIDSLKKSGYRLVATSPAAHAVPIQDFDITKGKFALMFGTEKFGLTDEAFNAADELIKIPMYGFTESFNISVSVSLSLFHFTQKLRNSDVDWKLPYEEKLDVLLQWYRNTAVNFEKTERHFQETILKKNPELI